jgi:transposase
VIDERDSRIAKLEAENAELRAVVAKLLARIEALEAQLGQNSSNSNLPPSTDAPDERRARPKKGPSGRKRGGQPGHKGWKRELLPPEKVTGTKECFPSNCRRCGSRLPRRPDPAPLRHQVVEVPVIAPDVIEFRQHRVVCDCGEVTCGELPAGTGPGMFGPRMLALIGLMTGVYHVSRRRAVGWLGDVLNIEISLGALSEAEERVSEAIAASVEQVREHVSEQPVKHVDATGWRQRSQARTLWTIATKAATFFAVTVDGTRGKLRALFKSVTGILVTDRGTQFGFWAMDHRQICWAHLIRKFASFADRTGQVGELGERLTTLAQLTLHWWHQVRDGTLSIKKFRKIAGNLRPVFEGHLEAGVRLGVLGVSGSCADILAHRAAMWTFVDAPGVEPTNNHAERELRSYVLWRKQSFGSQSERGDRFAERIMTVAHTLRKQGRNVLAFLTSACEASARGTTPPSLVIANP